MYTWSEKYRFQQILVQIWRAYIPYSIHVVYLLYSCGIFAQFMWHICSIHVAYLLHSCGIFALSMWYICSIDVYICSIHVTYLLAHVIYLLIHVVYLHYPCGIFPWRPLPGVSSIMGGKNTITAPTPGKSLRTAHAFLTATNEMLQWNGINEVSGHNSAL